MCDQSILVVSVRYRLFILFFEKNSNLDVMSSVVKLMMDGFFTEIHGYYRIKNRRNYFSFDKYYSIIVHNKTTFNTTNMQTVFDEISYIFEYFIVNIFSFLIVFDWEKSKTRTIFIHRVLKVQNQR